MHENENESEVARSCPTLSNPMDYSLPGSSVHGIFQDVLERVLEWVAIAFSRPSLGIANYQLTNLFNTLKGDPNLNSPLSLYQEAQEELYLVQNKLQKQFLTLIRLDLHLELFILPSLHSPTGLLAQQEHPIEWIYTHFRGMKSLTPYLDLIAPIITNERNRTKTLSGSDPRTIVIPVNKSQFENALQTSTDF